MDLVAYLGVWYIGNMAYSTYNKNAGNECGGTDYSMAVATAQLAVGVLYAAYLWVAPDCRKFPQVTMNDIIRLVPAGVCSAGAHAASVFSLAAGGVAFGQIVKATEPVFSAVIGQFVYGKSESVAKWLCLIPIIGGVAITVLKPKKGYGYFEPDTKFSNESFLQPVLDGGFSMGSLVGAMIANACAAVKNTETKKVMDDKSTSGASGKTTIKDRIGGSVNQFAIMTIISLVASIPLCVAYPFFNGKDAHANLTTFYEKVTTKPAAIKAILYSGFAFYLYNEFATLCLTKLGAVTSSVANTAKRVFVIIAGIVMYEDERKKATEYTAIGCAICMIGVALYACIDDLLKPSIKAKAH